ncbi:MAG: CopG family transcriptional regulator [Candidatus Omnitrophica bacterium CG11_big_fil_rev_8_21_14_0_20_64_10]|nr:MAG: CopG family transcriptional regulator [Candidatus Omnitrophica bacterium CG11_big_fil_rev_8_21_14_0_20_64_10]
MKARDDWEMPTGKLKRVEDFLPPPSRLVLGEKTTKITIALKQSSVNFFKRQAKRNHTKYQKMIREVLDRYASRYRAD